MAAALAGCGLSGVGGDKAAHEAYIAEIKGTSQDSAADSAQLDALTDAPDAAKAAADAAVDAETAGDSVWAEVAAAQDSSAAQDGAETTETADSADSGAEIAGASCQTSTDCGKPEPCETRDCHKGICEVHPIECPASANPCAVAKCNPATKLCEDVTAADATSCDNGKFCTKGGSCYGGKCTVPMSPCDDKNPCTTDSCDPTSDKCVATPFGPNACDDGNQCTNDVCNLSVGCDHTPKSAMACDDGIACTAGDSCNGSTCLPGKDACTPKNACYIAKCDVMANACAADQAIAASANIGCGNGGKFEGLCVAGKCLKLWGFSVAVGPTHACATTLAGVQCWGSNGSQQIGAAGLPSQTTPTLVAELDGPGLAAGNGFTCAIQLDGTVACRGDNSHQQLGKAASGPVAPAVAVGGVSNAKLIAAGDGHVCAAVGGASPKVLCWGAGTSGQLGSSAVTTDQAAPVAVAGLGAVDALAAGGSNTCAVAGGAVYCWGKNAVAWADPATSPKAGAPAVVKGVDGIAAIAVGDHHGCGIVAKTATLVCWGDNLAGELGVAPGSGNTVETGKFKNVTAVAAGKTHTCIVADGDFAGQVQCFGANDKLQLGPGGATGTTKPVAGSTKAVASAGYATCANRWDGSVFCFGADADGATKPAFEVPGSAPVTVFE